MSDSPPEELDPETAAKQRRDRLEQNRISARESRKRKKTMIEELQRTVITLSKENKELNERNEFLRRELVEIGTKHPGLVPIQALMRGGALGAVPGVDDEPLELDDVKEEMIAVQQQQQQQPPVPQAASSSGVASSSNNTNNNAQQMALMQQMVQMQALAGMNPAMMNPAIMGMMAGMGGVPPQAGVGQQSQQQQQQQTGGTEGQGQAKSE